MLEVAIHQTPLGFVAGDYSYRLHVVNSVQVRVELIANKTWINIAYPKGDYITTMRVYSLVGWSGC